MTRGLPSSYVTALNGGSWRICTFVSVAYTGGTVYLHDSIGTIEWGGQQWLGIGTFGGIDTVEEGEEVSPYALTATLSGVDITLAPEVLAGDFAQAAISIYFGMLGDGQALLGESGTAQAGAATTITLAAGASGTDSYYNGRTIRITSGTGAGSVGLVTGYVGSTKVATIAVAWAVNPASGSGYAIDDIPTEMWAGKVDTADVLVTDETATITLTCESLLAEFDRASGLLFSESALIAVYSDDTFFKYLPAMQDRQIEWKETRGSSAGVSVPSAGNYARIFSSSR
jgi:hypothetical protein